MIYDNIIELQGIMNYKSSYRFCPGRITEFKIGEPGHSMSVACYLHTKCSVVRLISRLPYGACTLCMNYLEAGLRVKDRNDSAAHKRMLLVDVQSSRCVIDHIQIPKPQHISHMANICQWINVSICSTVQNTITQTKLQCLGELC